MNVRSKVRRSKSHAAQLHSGASNKALYAGAVLLAATVVGCSHESSPAANVAGRGAGKTVTAKSGAATDHPAKPASARTGSGATDKIVVKLVTPEEFKQFIVGQKGKVVLADFWATYCVPCREKYPQTLALARKYADKGLAVVSMSMDSPDPADQRKVRRFLEEQHSQIANLANRLEDTDAAFGALDIDGGALPHYKVFDREGKLRAKFGGDPDHGFDEKDIETAVVAALAEKK